jgi:S1-C subfamily serine protease
MVAVLGLVGIFVDARPAAADGAYCLGEYAEDLASLSARARAMETTKASYSYAVRTTATYECVSYGSDGDLKKRRVTTQAYGTAFGYRREGGDTLLATNQHVAEWPAVTDDEHPVDGVPVGCKRIADALKIVDDDHDDYAADDIPLVRVVADAGLDIAVLRAHTKLEIIPWKIGRSAGLVTRNVVEVKGFPLGAFQATNIGKVVSAYDHDTQGDRDHDDFVIDALLTSGGSGSPVFAVSCKTGEFELVGVFHARYSGASALNVVVAVDQIRELLATLKRPPSPRDRPLELDGAARIRLTATVRQDPDPAYFLVGPFIASLRTRGDGALVFALFGSDFPRTTRPLLAIEDLPADDPKAFGKPGAIYVGGVLGLQRYAESDGDVELQTAVGRTLQLLREDALATFAYREAARTTAASRTAFDKTAGKKRLLDRLLDTQRDLGPAITDLISRVGAKTAGATLGLADIEADPPPQTTALAGGQL